MSGYLNHSFVNSDKDDGSPQLKVVENKIKTRMTYQWNDLSVMPRFRWVDEMPFDGNTFPKGGSSGQSAIDSFSAVDLSLRGDSLLLEDSKVYLTVNNLLDEKYYTPPPSRNLGIGSWIASPNRALMDKLE